MNFDILKTKTVLYVEDEPNTAEFMRRLLSRYTAEVRTAPDGRQGLETFLEWKPDIVITDLEMPVMNGSEMIHFIREKDPERIIVIITAFEDEAAKIREMTNMVLIKPVSKDRLLSTLISFFPEA